jgi:hypothetical protein
MQLRARWAANQRTYRHRAPSLLHRPGERGSRRRTLARPSSKMPKPPECQSAWAKCAGSLKGSSTKIIGAEANVTHCPELDCAVSRLVAESERKSPVAEARLRHALQHRTWPLRARLAALFQIGVNIAARQAEDPQRVSRGHRGVPTRLRSRERASIRGCHKSGLSHHPGRHSGIFQGDAVSLTG